MYNIIYRYIIIIAYKKFILILLLQKSLNIMKIIDLLFVNTFKQHVGNHDQCHPIWLCNRGSTTVVANLSFQRFFFFERSNIRARTNGVKIVSIVNSKRKNSIRECNNPI